MNEAVWSSGWRNCWRTPASNCPRSPPTSWASPAGPCSKPSSAANADPQILADLAKRKLRNKIPELTEALTGRFREHHAFLTRLHLDQYDQLTTMIDQLTGRIEEAMAPFRGALDLLDTIPGINQATAEVIIAETGGDMTRFATAKHLASWAGVCPGHHESAGRTKNTKVRPGNPYLKGAPRPRRIRRRENQGHLPRTPATNG